MCNNRSEVGHLLKRRRRLEYELFKVNQDLGDLELEPYSPYGVRRNIGFPFDLLERAIRWLISVGIEQPVANFVNKALDKAREWLNRRKSSKRR